MRAVRYHEHGGPEVLRYEEVPDPRPGPGEVLLRVRACALNHIDIWNRRGLPGVEIPLPHIPGSDVAGEVLELGEGVTGWQPGDRVVVNPGLSCGRCPACLAGQDNLCRHFDVLGERSDGGYAEKVVVPAANLAPMPRNLSFEEAAAFPLVSITAWNMLVTRAGIRPGETVLVLGAGSGVGSAAVQIAKFFGCTVFATVGADDKVEKARALGADEVIHHGRQEIYQEVRRLTQKRGVDVVFEHVGEATFEQSVRCLRPGGRLVTCGATTGPRPTLDLRYVFYKHLAILGTHLGSKRELFELLPLVEAGRLRPVVDRVLPLREAAEAHRIMESRQHFGKLVLVP